MENHCHQDTGLFCIYKLHSLSGCPWDLEGHKMGWWAVPSSVPGICLKFIVSQQRMSMQGEIISSHSHDAALPWAQQKFWVVSTMHENLQRCCDWRLLIPESESSYVPALDWLQPMSLLEAHWTQHIQHSPCVHLAITHKPIHTCLSAHLKYRHQPVMKIVMFTESWLQRNCYTMILIFSLILKASPYSKT